MAERSCRHLRVIGGGLLRSGGNAVFQLNHRQSPITPGLHQIAGQICQGLIRAVGELAGIEVADGAGLAGGIACGPVEGAALAAKPLAASALRCRGTGGRWPSSGRTKRDSNTSRSFRRAM